MKTASAPPQSPDFYRHVSRTLCLLLWSILAVLVVLYATRPIGDVDFWWHLKTGDILLQQKKLLAIDPFNYTGDVLVHGREAVILNGYWLWQITAAALYSAWQIHGIIGLKLLTAALISWALLREMRFQQLSPATQAVLAGLGGVVFMDIYNLERPQVFTIFFLTLIIGMISRLRAGEPPSRMLVPVMIIWANIHGGFVVGDIILLLAAAGFLIQYRQDNRLRLRLAAWAGAGILASFINPNGWNAFMAAFNFVQQSFGSAQVYEYRSTWQLFLDGSSMSAVILWGLAVLHASGLLLAGRRNWPEIFISLFIIAFGLKYIRNTGFIAISLLPVTGWYAKQACAKVPRRFFHYGGIGAVLVVMAVSAGQVRAEWQLKKTMPGTVAPYFPAEMASFLLRSGLSGNLFNEYNTGGYLDWALYPHWRTFIDSRELDTRVAGHYDKIIYGSREYAAGRPTYALLLDSYQVDVIALKIAFTNGRLQPLLKLLLPDPQWTPVFLDSQSFVLARNTPANAGAIRQHGLDKTAFLEQLTGLLGKQAQKFPADIALLVAYADILLLGGNQAGAEPVIKKLAAINGLDPEIMAYLRHPQ